MTLRVHNGRILDVTRDALDRFDVLCCILRTTPQTIL